MSASWLVGGAILVVVIWVALRRFPRRESWLPKELARARLRLVERDIFIDKPYAMAGRPDRVYELQNGLLMPLEFKNRNRFVTYETDIAELSLQAWMLRRCGHATSSDGYVTIRQRGTGEHRCLRVRLLDDSECLALIQRYRAIMSGQVEPRTCPPRRCGTCEHGCFPEPQLNVAASRA